jgi:Protein of unknown function (DUF2568)
MSSPGTPPSTPQRSSGRRADAPADALEIVQLVLAFLLEVAMLASLCYWGFRFPYPANLLAGIGVPAVVAVFWALAMAPRARHRIRWPFLPAVATGLFLLSAAALVAAGQPGWAAVLAAAAAVWAVLTVLLHRRNDAGRRGNPVWAKRARRNRV